MVVVVDLVLFLVGVVLFVVDGLIGSFVSGCGDSCFRWVWW